MLRLMKMQFTMEHDNEDNTKAHLGQYYWLGGLGHPNNSSRTPVGHMESKRDRTVSMGRKDNTLHPINLASDINPRSNSSTQDQEKRLTKPHNDLIL